MLEIVFTAPLAAFLAFLIYKSMRDGQRHVRKAREDREFWEIVNHEEWDLEDQ